jgi:hypothetical protein
MIIHGWAKSYKSFIAFDMLARLAQCQDWCCFEPTEEPVKTAAIQFEIPWAFYHERVTLLQTHAIDEQLFNENYHTWRPIARAQLTAGNARQEDLIRRELVESGMQVVLIDPIRRAAGASDMNAENEMSAMFKFFDSLQREGLTVVATHHDNKEGARAGGGNMLAMTGSGRFAGDPDTVISVETVRGDDPETSPRRNLNFVLRNAPMIGPRSMQIMDDGRIVYDNAPIDTSDGPAEEVESDDPAPPSI